MLLNWLNARDVTELGRSLADHFAPPAHPPSAAHKKTAKLTDQKTIQTFLQRVDREARPLKLSFYKRAKLANSFKWKLLEHGVDQHRIDELTQVLLLRLSATAASPVQTNALDAPPPKRLKPSSVNSLLTQADEYVARRAFTEAVRCHQGALEINPRHAGARNALGSALCELGRYNEAETEFRRAIEIRHNFPDALCNLGTVLRWKGRFLEAETPLRRALKLSPRHCETQVSLGLALSSLGRLREAEEHLKSALKMAPRNVGAWVGLAEIAAFEGHFDEAEALYKRALEIDPKAPTAWAPLARLRKMTRADDAWLKGAEDAASGGLAPLEEATLRFAIGKYWDDIGEFARAFQSYRRANELQKSAAGDYDRQARTSLVDDLIRIYAGERLSRGGPGASDSERPVFVVGMMRSGTSLVEQIVSSHPDAKGAGELDFWNSAFRKHEAVLRHEPPAEALKRKLSDAYLRILDGCSPQAARVVDKSTLNSDYLGIIHTAFPKARFIYMRRDPIDTCLSCYFQQLPPALSFAMDLSDLAHFYRVHQRLIAHWRTVLPPGTLLDVPYAELVADQEKWTREILGFLGLAWNERCLAFHETSRPVLTASTWQVRQKMYNGSVGRWRNYRKFIGPLLELVDEAGP